MSVQKNSVHLNSNKSITIQKLNDYDHSLVSNPKFVAIQELATVNTAVDIEFYDMLYSYRLKKSAEHFFDQKVQAKRM